MSRAKTVFVCALMCISGGMLYCALEILYRGRTHFSMFLAGGVCVFLLYLISAKSRVPAWKKCIAGCAAITAVEFITGGVVNLALGLHVWDYSNMRMNLMGQICPQFSLIWALLCIPVMWVLKFVDSRIIKGGRPV